MFGVIASSFGKNFLIGYLVPAVLFVFANVILAIYCLLPFRSCISLEEFGIETLGYKLAALFFIATFFAIVLQQSNMLIIKLYEGYYGWRWFPLRQILKRMTRCQKNLYKKRKEEIDQLNRSKKDTRSMEHDLSRAFPADENQILPTRLGNIMRASEYYVHQIYNIDPITIWPRLTAVIPQFYAEQIEKTQTTVSFVLNLSFISAILGFECLAQSVVDVLELYRGIEAKLFVIPILVPFSLNAPELLIIISLICFILSYIFYLLSCLPAGAWGEYIRSVFDLYRYDLFKQMSLHLPSEPITLRREWEIWNLLQKHTFYAKNPEESESSEDLKLEFLSKSPKKEKLILESLNYTATKKEVMEEIKKIHERLEKIEESILTLRGVVRPKSSTPEKKK